MSHLFSAKELGSTFCTSGVFVRMGLTLMINTTMTSLTIVTLSESRWFSYVLFLIFLRGVLVLFTYVTSLASNEMFRLNTKTVIIPPITIIMVVMIMMLDPY